MAISSVTDPTTTATLQNVQNTTGFAVLHNVLALQAIQAETLVQSIMSAGEPPHVGNRVDAHA